MSLTFTELEAITDDYFLADNKKAIDIYFTESFLLDRWMNKHTGMWERPDGGKKIRIPLAYDIAEGGAYERADTLSSDDKEILNAAYFGWKHYYGNATIFRTDELQNAGEYAEVQLVESRISAAQKKVTKDLSTDIYGSASDTAKQLTGFLTMFNATTSTKYGDIAEADLVAQDGTKPWKANLTITSEGISLAVLRTLASTAKIGNGKEDKPNIGVTTETLFNIIKGILQAQQQFIKDDSTVKAGFTNLVFEEMILNADDYCPSGYSMLFNEAHTGFAVHKSGFFVRAPWADMIVAGKAAKAMKIFWDGNLINRHRKANAAHSNLS
jgi:hypothetical protein